MPDYTLSAKITGDSSGFEKAFSSAQKAAQNFEKVMSTVGKKVSDIGQKMQDAGSKLTGVTTAFAGVAAIGVKYNASMETYSTSFETMTGSAEKAAEIMQQLQKIGAETPFEFEDLAKTTNTLMQFGFTADEAIESMQMLGDISQGSAQKMDSITRAFGKMSSSGKVSLEDINMMIDAGFNPLQEISQTTGESMADLYARISDGAMSVDEITASMQRATSEGGMYFQSMDKQSQTFSGQLSTLSDNAQSFLGNITSGIFEKLAQDILPKVNEAVSLLNDAFEAEGMSGVLSVIQSIVPQLEPVFDAFDTFREKLDALGIDPMMFAGAVAAAGPLLIVLGKITSVTGGVISGLGSVTGGLGKFAESMRLAGSNGTVLSGVMTKLTSPMGATIAIIAAVAAAFAYLMATNDDFRASVMNTVSEVSASLKPSLELIGSTLMELGSTLMQSIGSVLQALAPSLAQIVAIIGDVLAMLGPVVAMLVASLVPVLEQVISMATQILTVVTPFIGLLIGQMMPAIQQIIVLVGAMLGQIIPLISQLTSALMPVIQQILALAMQVISAVMPLIISLINQLIPFISEIVSLVGNLLAAVVPLITQLISQLAPVISEIISAVSEIISTLLPPLISIIEAIMSVVEALMPPIMEIIDVVVEVISTVIDTISPIIAFITEIIQKIIGIISPIVQFISEIIARIVSFVAPLIETFAGIFGSIFNVVSKIMSNIGEFIGGIFEGVKKAWDGLTGFVSGVIDGISSAFDTVVGTIKSIFNVVIGAINGAIWTINLIPGVHIDEMPYLLHGTDDWQGGFARMNEGGRGELTYLPNGAQVIPHDISVKYAKEAARANTQAPTQTILAIDYDRLAAAMTRVRLTPVMEIDGAQVSRVLSPYTDQNMSQRTRMAARGME